MQVLMLQLLTSCSQAGTAQTYGMDMKHHSKVSLQLVSSLCVARWHGRRVMDLQSVGRGFESQPSRCHVQPWASC